MNTPDFLKQQVPLFHDFSSERLQQLVDGSRIVSFEAKEAIDHRGDEATHLGVVLSGSATASAIGDGGTRQLLGQFLGFDWRGERDFDRAYRVIFANENFNRLEWRLAINEYVAFG